MKRQKAFIFKFNHSVKKILLKSDHNSWTTFNNSIVWNIFINQATRANNNIVTYSHIANNTCIGIHYHIIT